ncbi:MAG: L,D-transpeptidase family protein [Alphaproteobacteria bacterium]|nr:MAG: L,D-transpeptidase family protein [Alphaproteobacteria bacterium]
MRGRRWALLDAAGAVVFGVVVSSMAIAGVSFALPVSADTAVPMAQSESAVLEQQVREGLPSQWSDLLRHEITSFYQKRNFAPAWLKQNNAAEMLVMRQLAASVREAVYAQGMRVGPYNFENLHTLAGDIKDVRHLAGADVMLTALVLRYALEARVGQINPRRLHNNEWSVDPPAYPAAERLAEAVDKGTLSTFLSEAAPANPSYMALQHMLGSYRQFALQGGWGVVAEGGTLKKDGHDPRVAQLRARLVAGGDLVPPPPIAVSENTEALKVKPEEIFDDTVEAAVRRFQVRHGLPVSGQVDKFTLAALNVPVGDRIAQIQANMERWRWQPRDLGMRYVAINAASATLQLVEEGKVSLELPVIVGRRHSPTPFVTSAIDTIVINPPWNVPPAIARKEILPKLSQDEGYLERHGYVWRENGGLQQRPGAGNSLGRVKFDFVSPFGVYLHGTPGRNLFARAARTLSHGCVRLRDPEELAAILLGGEQEETQAHIDELIEAGSTKRLSLDVKVPIHIQYWTALVDAQGALHVLPDVYGRDSKLNKALNALDPPVPSQPTDTKVSQLLPVQTP